jgi:hypothetical protein
MKRKTLFQIAGLMLLFYGCDTYIISSLNPFYLEKNIVLEPGFEGSWIAKPLPVKNDSASSFSWNQTDTTSRWIIKRFIAKGSVKNKQGKDSATYKPENFYVVKLASISDSICKFKVVLFKLNRVLYADFIPTDKEGLLKSQLAANGFFEVHTLARVTLNNNLVGLSWLGADCMKEMIEKKRVRVNYKWVKQADKFLLTASPQELTGMIERYGGQSRFIDWESQGAQLELNRLN